jgi:hypothetical protein
MRYGFKLLNNVTNVNDFKATDSLEIVSEEGVDIYFQLVDAEEDLRFMPPVTVSTMQVSFTHIDSSQNITDRSAVQPFPNDDRSIWKVTIMAGESIAPNGMSVKYFDGTKTYSLHSLSDLTIASNGNDSFYC